MTTPIQEALTAARVTSGPGRVATGEEIQDRFLTLLVTQMRNQDPLKPMDNAQITSQLAQISTVTGIEKLNASIETLAGAFQSGQMLAAASLIGHQGMVEGDRLSVSGGAGSGGFELQQRADNVVVTIQGEAGNTLARLDLGARDAGVSTFTWDGTLAAGGRAADGNYRFTVEARAGRDPVAVTTLGVGAVTGVSLDDSRTVTIRGLGDVDFADVRAIQ